MRGFGKCTLWISVAEGSVAGDVAAEAIVNNRRVRRQRSQWVNIRGERPVSHVDQVDGILGLVSVGRNDDGNRFAHIPHPPHGDRPAFDRRLDADDEAGCQGLDVVAGQDRDNAICAQRGRQIDRKDLGMSMWRAQDRGV